MKSALAGALERRRSVSGAADNGLGADLLSGMMLSGYERDDASDNSDEELAFAVHDHAQADALTGRAVYLDLCQQEGLTPTSNFIDKIALETVNLRFHGLKPAMVRAIAEALKLNQFVRSIDLAENIVGDTAGYAMAEVLAVNTVLTELDISGTGMTAKSAIPFARMLERGNRTLTKLRMNSNAIGDRGGAAIAHALERNTILAQLDLSRCRIGAAGATALGNALLVDAGLRGLDLAWNDLHNAGADAIVAGLESSFLHTINLSYCGMGDAAGVALGEALGDNGTLTSLDCSHNRLERAAAEALAAALRSNTTLKALRMGFNPIGYDGTAAVLAALEDNLAITVLGLENTLVCIDMQPRDLAKEAREKAAEEAARKAAAEAGDKKKGGKGKAPAGKGKKGKKEEAPPGPPPEPEPPKPPKPTVAWCYAQLEEVLSRRPKLARVMLEFPYIGPPEHGGADKYPPIAEAEAKARAEAKAIAKAKAAEEEAKRLAALPPAPKEPEPAAGGAGGEGKKAKKGKGKGKKGKGKKGK